MKPMVIYEQLLFLKSMTILKPILALFLIGGVHTAFSQKEAPVAGDAIKLVKLLNKDYSTIAPDQRAEQIIRDRAEAIRTLKVYLPEEKNNRLYTSEDGLLEKEVSNLQGKIQKAYSVYTDEKKTLEAKAVERSQPIGFKTSATPAVSGAEVSGLNQSLENYRNHLYSMDSIGFVTLKEAFGSNSYLGYIVEELHQKHASLSTKKFDTRTDQTVSATVQKGLPFVGGDLSFTTAMDGLSRFLATRIKEELTTYVIDKVKEWLANPSDESLLNELKILLPKTTNYLLQFRADQMLNFGDEMKQYIEEDLNDLLENLPNLRNTPRFERLLEMHPDIDFAFEALELIPKMAQMKRPLDYFEILENSRTLGAWNTSDNALKQNITNAIDLTCMLARSFTTRENGQLELITLEEISSYLENTEFYLIYFGLLHQQNVKYYQVKFSTSVKQDFIVKTITKTGTTEQKYTADKATPVQLPLSSLMLEMMASFNHDNLSELEEAKRVFEAMLSELGVLGDRVNGKAMELKKRTKKGEKIPIELAHEFVSALLDFSEEATLAGDSLVNFLMQEIAGLGRVVKEITIDTRTEVPSYTITFANATDAKPSRIQLYAKVSPYISAARTANDIVLDLHNENYVTALLKALEIATTMLPENGLTRITAAVQSVTDLSEKVNSDDLALLLVVKSEDIKAGAKFEKIKKDFELQVTNFERALTKWMFYFRANYPANPQLESNVSAVKAVLTNIKKGGATKITESDLKTFITLASNEAFQKLIIAYYSNQNLYKLADELEKELVQLKVTMKGDEVSLFSQSEATAFKNLFVNYISGTIDWLLAAKDDKKGEQKKLTNLQGELEEFIANYAFAFPEKLSIDPNSEVVRLIHLVNDLAKAKDAEDVEKAIEAFALPSGSYAIKRTAKFNVAVNAYPGLLFGPEFTRMGGSLQTNMSASLTAPIGLSFAWGTNKRGSFGAFIPVIDIGAFTRVHLDADTNTFALPEINFGNVFSPGLYFSYGFPKSPLSINLGGQYGPQLRRIEANGEAKSYESWRLGAGIVLDIPLFNVYTTPRLGFK